MLNWFPMILIVIVLYNLLVFFGPTVLGTDANMILARSVDLTMFSGDVWRFSVGDLLVLLGFAMLFVEVVKSTRTGAMSILNHGLSMLTFVVALIEFLVLSGFSTTTFFFLGIMALFDVVAGFTISIVGAKRDFGAGGGLIGTG